MNALDHGTGIEIIDLLTSKEFNTRTLHDRAVDLQLRGLRSVANVFAERPDDVLDELVKVIKTLSDADSAGVSLETEDESGAPVFYWVARVGTYERFKGASYRTCGCLAASVSQR